MVIIINSEMIISINVVNGLRCKLNVINGNGLVVVKVIILLLSRVGVVVNKFVRLFNNDVNLEV